MAKIAIPRFRVQDYRSCKDTEVSFCPDITALVGPNGSGKTNILQALMLFGQPADFPKQENAQQCRVEVDFLRARRLVQYRGTITYRSNEGNSDEALFFKERWNLTKKNGEKTGWINDEDLAEASLTTGSRFFISMSSSRLRGKTSRIARATRSPKSKMAELARHLSIIHELSTFSSEMQYYSASQFTNPTLCPTAFEIDEDGRLRLEPDLRNSTHSKFLHDLYLLSQKPRHDVYDLFLSFVDKRGLGLISDISWRAVEVLSETHEVRSGGKVERKKKKRILVIPTVRSGASKLSFNQLSEGTFRTLALIFYIVSNENSMMLIEEPEVCVHHGLLTSVINILKEYSRTKQIVFSTHSEAVVDMLKPEQLRLVEHSARKGTSVETVAERFSGERLEGLKEYLMTSGSLGEFWKSSGF